MLGSDLYLIIMALWTLCTFWVEFPFFFFFYWGLLAFFCGFCLSEDECLKISSLFLPCQNCRDGSGASRRQLYFFRCKKKSGKLDLLISAKSWLGD